MTDLDIIKNVILSLDRINVPTAYIEQIAVPIFEADRQLKALYNHYTQKIKEEEKKESSEEIKMEEKNEEVDSDEEKD